MELRCSTSLQYVTGAAHIRFSVKTPAAAAPPSATISAMSAFGLAALRPPAMPVKCMPVNFFTPQYLVIVFVRTLIATMR